MEKNSIGVIIGRFQIHSLHGGHRNLIETVKARHERVLIMLGVAPFSGTFKDPLDFNTRLAMFRSEYPSVVVIPMPDAPSDKAWSESVDRRIREAFPHGDVVIYGGRDSFIPHYSGRFKTQEVIHREEFSASLERDSVSVSPMSTPDFRAGIIYSIYNKYGAVMPTVDAAILRDSLDRMSKPEEEILLVKKPGESGWRLPGGFVDLKDENLEDAVKREVLEEVDISILGEPFYLGSFSVQDWRTKKSNTKILTNLFMVMYQYGSGTPHDDVNEAQWFKISDVYDEMMEPYHIPLIHRVKAFLANAPKEKGFELVKE